MCSEKQRAPILRISAYQMPTPRSGEEEEGFVEYAENTGLSTTLLSTNALMLTASTRGSGCRNSGDRRTTAMGRFAKLASRRKPDITETVRRRTSRCPARVRSGRLARVRALDQGLNFRQAWHYGMVQTRLCSRPSGRPTVCFVQRAARQIHDRSGPERF